MKLYYNNKEIYELAEWQKKVIKNDIPASIFESDMTRRCKGWLERPAAHYCHVNQEKMRKELAAAGERTIPTDLIELGRKSVEKKKDLKMAHADIPVPCKCGDQSFELAPAYRKICREMHKERYANMDEAAVAAEEEKENVERMAWILQHKFERCMDRLRNEWIQRLASKGVTEVPASDEEFANLVFSQPDYKDREARDAEEVR